MKKKIEKMFFVFEIITSEFVALNLSLSRTEYFPSALSVLGNIFEILHFTNRDFCETIDYPVINK